jgi:hypothetical protein
MKNVILKRGDDSVAVSVRFRKKTAQFTYYQGTDFLMDKSYEDLQPARKEYDKLIADGYKIAF